MKSIMNRSLVAAAVLASLAAVTSRHSALAADSAAPQPDEAIRKLMPIAGTFEGEAAFTMDGKTTRFRLHHENRKIASGFGLLCHEEADIPGLGRYEAENLFGWDAGKKRIHLFSVTNDPYTHDHAGTWTGANTLQLRYEGLMDGKRYVEVIPMTLVGNDEYRFKSTTTLDGKTFQSFTADMKRVTATSSR